MEYLLVALGSAVGGFLRFLIYKSLHIPNYYITLLINFIGSFLIASVLVIKSELIKLFFITGILAGFTTFSGFTIDSVRLFQNGEYIKCLMYVMLSYLLSLAGFLLCKYLIEKYII